MDTELWTPCENYVKIKYKYAFPTMTELAFEETTGDYDIRIWCKSLLVSKGKFFYSMEEHII
jgi:hypothetical protein